MKTCKTCKEEKQLDSFYFNKKTGYYSSDCKVCYIGNVLETRRNNKRECKLDNCNKKHYGLGYCRKHYERFKQGGESYINKVFHGAVNDPRTLRKYGITEEQFIEMSKDGCQICGVQISTFAIDHDHACCDAVPYCGSCTRGYVCYSCNTNLARYEKGVMHHTNPLKDKVIKYLENYQVRRNEKGSR
jgi:hypothetical protein